jgi:hypothetical protein
LNQNCTGPRATSHNPLAVKPANPFVDKNYALAIALAAQYGDAVALTFEGCDFSFRDIRIKADRAAAKFTALGVKRAKRSRYGRPIGPNSPGYGSVPRRSA